jgi:outer membrane protein assembly factor BamA
MKKALLFSFLVCITAMLFSQQRSDSVKTGWNFGGLPAIAYDSDLGIFYGIILNPFDYGNGSRYPNYCQQILMQVARYTGGSSEHYIDYDSYSLIHGVRFLARLRYVGNQAFPFYGFNGRETYYNKDWEDSENAAYKSRMFYRQDRRILQVFANLLDTIGKSRFQLRAGWEMVNYNIDTVNVARLNRKHSSEDALPYVPTLYELYSDWGIIKDSEREGGLMNSFLVGLIYDSRNQLTNPSKGIYSEITMRWYPSFLSKEKFSGLNAGIIHRHYLSLYKDRVVFAYRLWLNAGLGGDLPYFTRQLLTTFASTDGYGGFNTLRGVMMQRIVTGDFLLANAEFRTRLVNFWFIKQNWYLGAVAFVDAGRILKPLRVDLGGVPPAEKLLYFRDPDKTLHKTIGGGLKLVMNQNFVLSAEFGKALDSQDGTSGLYLGITYLF